MGTTKKPRRKFTDDFKADAVKVWRESGDTKDAVAERLGIHGTTLGSWIKQADIDDGKLEGTTSETRQISRSRTCASASRSAPRHFYDWRVKAAVGPTDAETEVHRLVMR